MSGYFAFLGVVFRLFADDSAGTARDDLVEGASLCGERAFIAVILDTSTMTIATSLKGGQRGLEGVC